VSRAAWNAVIAAGILAGCGQASTPVASSSADRSTHSAQTTSPSPTSSLDPPDVVTRPQWPPDVLHVVSLTARVVGTVTSAGIDMGRYGVGPHHVWVTNRSLLYLYGASGASLAEDRYSAAHLSSGPVFTSDGSSWAWSFSPNPQEGGTTTIYLGTQAAQMKAIATHTDSAGQRLTPIRWAAGKVYLTEYTVVGGGRITFPMPASAWSLDPASGTLLEVSPSCRLEDVAPDGSLLCLQGQALTVVHPDGTSSAMTLPGAWEQEGAAQFSPDGRTLLVSAVTYLPSTSVGATYMGSATGGNLQKVADTPFGAYFLPDGRLLEQKPTGWLLTDQSGANTPVALPPGEFVLGILPSPAD
jgi:hypothetical protein